VATCGQCESTIRSALSSYRDDNDDDNDDDDDDDDFTHKRLLHRE